MEILNQKVRKKLLDYTKSNYEQIVVVPGKCRYNYMCHMNAVHEAMKHDHDELVMTIAVEGNYPYVHFVNVKDGIFTDNTLGQWSQYQTYYLVKRIKKDEFYDVPKMFDAFRETIRQRFTWFERLFSDFTG